MDSSASYILLLQLAIDIYFISIMVETLKALIFK